VPILNLNGVNRKHGLADGRTIKGSIFGVGLADTQHKTLTVIGKTYNSPFTQSSANLFPRGRTLATQPQMQAVKVETPGKVVSVKKVVRVPPWEKGSHFSTTQNRVTIARRAGGPSKEHDTATTPNDHKLRVQSRPKRSPMQDTSNNKSTLSFLRSGGTIGGHVDPQAGTSSGTSRWSVVKRGAVG
jgi:hypothetical protein